MTIDVELDEDGGDMAEQAAVCSSGELAAVAIDEQERRPEDRSATSARQ